MHSLYGYFPYTVDRKRARYICVVHLHLFSPLVHAPVTLMCTHQGIQASVGPKTSSFTISSLRQCQQLFYCDVSLVVSGCVKHSKHLDFFRMLMNLDS